MKNRIFILLFLATFLSGCGPDSGKPGATSESDSGWRSLSNGKDLSGWHVQNEKGQHGTGGNWGTSDKGVIFGEQDPPGSGNGGFLLSNEKFDDFEFEISMRPDWGPCSGIFLRTNEKGEGWQVYVDHHDKGNVGHVRLESKAYSVPFRPYFFNRTNPKKASPLETKPDTRIADWPEDVYQETCTAEQWLAAWKPDDWNRMKIRCTGKGKLPLIEVWINDLKICSFDAAKTAHPKFDQKKAEAVTQTSGSIGLQVHQGKGWPNGARVYWKDIRVKKL